MSLNLFLRKYARVPFSDDIILGDEEGLTKGQIINISLKGIYVETQKREIKSDKIHSLIRIPQMGTIRKLDVGGILEIKNLGFSEKVFRVDIDVIRKSSNSTQGTFGFAGTFQNVENEFEAGLKHFINNYSTNIIYLVKLLEKNKLSDEELEMTYLIANVLGRKEENLIELRNIIKRDFQNI